MILLAAVLAVVAACETSARTTVRLGYEAWTVGLAERDVDPVEVVYPFAPTPGLEAWSRDFATRWRALSPVAQLERLQQALFDRDEFPFTYDEHLTLNAGEAFEARRGNCMSFTALFIALSRTMGLRTFLVSVSRPPEFSKEEALVIVNRHVVAGYVQTGEMYLFDFYLTSDMPYIVHRIIDDLKATAMYHTNLGGDAIRRGDLDKARRHLELATRIEPELAAAWVNLGVVRFRSGEPAAAIDAYRRALEIEDDNSSALTNLAVVYRYIGEEDRARTALEAAARGGATPFALIALADSELYEGDLEQARKHLLRAKRRYRGAPEVFDALARLERRAGDPVAAARYQNRAERLRAREN